VSATPPLIFNFRRQRFKIKRLRYVRKGGREGLLRRMSITKVQEIKWLYYKNLKAYLFIFIFCKIMGKKLSHSLVFSSHSRKREGLAFLSLFLSAGA
jgi:hypothetical protein